MNHGRSWSGSHWSRSWNVLNGGELLLVSRMRLVVDRGSGLEGGGKPGKAHAGDRISERARLRLPLSVGCHPADRAAWVSQADRPASNSRKEIRERMRRDIIKQSSLGSQQENMHLYFATITTLRTRGRRHFIWWQLGYNLTLPSAIGSDK